jgi:hypothetical protein
MTNEGRRMEEMTREIHELRRKLESSKPSSNLPLSGSIFPEAPASQAGVSVMPPVSQKKIGDILLAPETIGTLAKR